MHGTLPVGMAGSSECAVASGSEKTSAVASDSEECGWFSELARGLLGKDAGLALHVTTGYPLDSCRKYAARSNARATPGNLIRDLLRSDQGRQWLNGIMAGCDAEWWLAQQRAERIVEQIDKLDLR